MPTFTVKLRGNVQELLLDAYRRIDEGQPARNAGRCQVANEVCFACPSEDDCSERVRKNYLRADHRLWRELSVLLDEQHEQLRDARDLYRSRAADDRPQLEALARDDGPWNHDRHS